jgi:hypothetical protein
MPMNHRSISWKSWIKGRDDGGVLKEVTRLSNFITFSTYTYVHLTHIRNSLTRHTADNSVALYKSTKMAPKLTGFAGTQIIDQRVK